MIDPYTLRFEELEENRNWTFTKVAGSPALSRATAEEVVAQLERAETENRILMVICPVGPIDYSYWAEAMNREQTDGSRLVTVNMDEYLEGEDRLIPESHPLSFRRFMNVGLFGRLTGRARVPTVNIHFPSPVEPEATTRLIEEHGGADLCYGGIGLTGHFAFNDRRSRVSLPTATCRITVRAWFVSAARARPRCAWAGPAAIRKSFLNWRLPSACMNC